ncbi:MAG: addiction module protein [Planctomycetes bacterium]|nr:addiction module protein [Planctomycetota bacterium]
MSKQPRQRPPRRQIMRRGRPEDILDAWVKEAERRLRACKEGRVEALPTEEVFREVRPRRRREPRGR